jgi:hypothetical protein
MLWDEIYFLIVGLPHHILRSSLETWPPLLVYFKSLVGSVLLIGLVFMCCVCCFACPRPVSCVQCCRFLWIVHSWLPLQFSLAFICPSVILIFPITIFLCKCWCFYKHPLVYSLILFTWLNTKYEKKVYTVMVINFININKAKNHLSS